MSDPDLLVDRTIAGRYRLEAVIGAGLTAAVYRAVQLDLDRSVAVKVLIDPGSEAERLADRFVREARIAATVRHPGIVEVFDYGTTDDGLPYFAMELLEGETLAAHIARVGRLAPEEAVAVAAGIASALGAVHAKGYLHRDVKSTNVFLVPRPHESGRDVKLVDFGLARALALPGPEGAKRLATLMGLGPKEASTLPGIVYGTPHYMAPEQVLGGALDARTDVYALAAVLYEMLVGEAVFDASETVRVLAGHLHDPPPPFAERCPEARVPAAIEKAVLQALEKRPEDRYATAAEFAAALWKALADAKAERSSGAPATALDATSAARGRDRAVALAVAIVAAGALVVLALRSGRRSAPSAPSAPPDSATSAGPAVLAPPPPSVPAVETAAVAPALPPSASPSATAGAPRARPPADSRATTTAVSPTAPAAPATTTPAAPPAAPPGGTGWRVDDLKKPFE